MTLVLAVVGWVLASFFGAMWLGEHNTRKVIENLHLYGTPKAMKRAVMVHPDDPESRLEDAIDEVLGTPKKNRQVRQDDTPPAYDPQTIENGVAFLLAEALDRGEQLSPEEARNEAIRMLNAEGPEMI